MATERMGLSARAYHRILKLSRTIALCVDKHVRVAAHLLPMSYATHLQRIKGERWSRIPMFPPENRLLALA
jgi:hypothetical protein